MTSLLAHILFNTTRSEINYIKLNNYFIYCIDITRIYHAVTQKINIITDTDDMYIQTIKSLLKSYCKCRF